MSNYNIEQCLKFLTIVGCNPEIQNSKLQLILYVISTSGSAFIIFLAILLFFYSDDALTIEDIANIFSTIIAFFYVISKLTMMYTKKKEVQDMLIKVDKSFWKIDDIINPNEKQMYSKMVQQTKQIFHLLVFLFMFWLLSTFGIYNLPMESYSFANLINQTFTVSMVVYVGNIVSLLCIYMYHLSIMTTPNIYTIRDFFVLLLTLYGFIICYCWPAQNFVDENENIRVSVYFSNWYEYLNYSKPILMIIKRLDLKVSISAGGIANINLETCLKVMKLAVSYYMFLRNTAS
nr:unnamed protein product [Callosobruchus analis]